jgi:hypothetical protein
MQGKQGRFPLWRNSVTSVGCKSSAFVGGEPLGSSANLTLSAEAAIAEVPTGEEHHGAQASLRDCYDGQPIGEARAPTLVISASSGDRLGTITFENDGPQERRLTSAQRIALRDHVSREIARLERWSIDHGWRHAWPQLEVIVADRYRISKSLVPAWNGNAGRMEVPAWRAVTGKAAIMHELVHVLFPSANRLLAEGLAIYLHAEIGGNPAFPNFGAPLHVVARAVLQELVPEFAAGRSLDAVSLAELDAIATPSPLTLHVGSSFHGEEPRGQGRIYPLAGSFVAHLIEARGLERFHVLYSQTPLVPLVQNAGPADRWDSVYGLPLADLEREWKSMIARQEPASTASTSTLT